MPHPNSKLFVLHLIPGIGSPWSTRVKCYIMYIGIRYVQYVGIVLYCTENNKACKMWYITSCKMNVNFAVIQIKTLKVLLKISNRKGIKCDRYFAQSLIWLKNEISKAQYKCEQCL